MTRLALLLSLAAGAAGCAATVRTQPTYATNEPATYERGRPDRVRSRWVTIADRYSAQSDRQFISVGGGEFRRIRLEAVRGAPIVQKVAIEFMNDPNVQVYEINARLPRGDGQVIDLNGGMRRVNRIVVYTEPGHGGAYSIYGA